MKVGEVKLVKSVITVAKPIKDLSIIDVKLNVNGPVEDEIYASFPFIIKTMRKFTDYSEMCDTLCKVFKDVAKSETAEEEKGT